MRIGFVGCLVSLLASAGLTLAQPAPPSRSVGPASPGGAALADPPPTPGTAAPDSKPAVQKVAGQGTPEAKPAAGPTQECVGPPPVGTQLWSDDPAPRHYPDDDSKLKEFYPCGYTWVSFDYLLWWLRPLNSPPLVTTGPATVPPAQFGALGSPGTSVLLGGGSGIEFGPTSGIRVSAGVQGPDHAVGLEGNFFLLENKQRTFHYASDAAGNPIIARPFTDAATGQSSRLLTSGPGAFSGALDVQTNSQFYGGEANLTHAAFGLLGCDSSFEIDLLAGFRYLNLSEHLSFSQNSTILPGGESGFNGAVLLAPTRLGVVDTFDTRNNFYGTQIGTAFEFQYCRFFLYGEGKVALGVVHEVVTVNGSTTMFPAGGGSVSTSGGLLALPSNIGRLAHTEFSAVPQVNLNAGFHITPNIRLAVGYEFIYWGTVARPGDQLSSSITVQQLPTSPVFGPTTPPVVPAPALRKSDFWANGLNFSVAFHF